MKVFTINIKSIKKYDDYEDKAREAAALFINVFNSQEFKNRVLHHKWKDKEQFADNQGLTNAQILESLIAGSEIAFEGKNHAADLHLRAYRKGWPFGPAIGHADADNGEIITKWRFIKGSSVKELAGHYAHEYCHLLGFGHDYDRTEQREYSVPYAVGCIVQELA
ncbi:MAG: hypothetical protein GC178_10215 [Flavobacteriales bacterium]|nr:hypothetical protein [Flavobacteriales bacterium]